MESGWPELAPATTLAATGVRPKTNLTLEGSVRLGEWPEDDREHVGDELHGGGCG